MWAGFRKREVAFILRAFTKSGKNLSFGFLSFLWYSAKEIILRTCLCREYKRRHFHVPHKIWETKYVFSQSKKRKSVSSPNTRVF